ncbi:hypothetical protein [Pedobacter panaciterrae]|jgi:hypothetical protein|uniref:Uncharacterized protein n=1 Tax=Pedobacter panaciterrae TaxID=363849 RepID=A0ABU8NTE4_9SPHI|nr:hypothetical protein [Pedobacter panaciterrae]NQX53432.1 hypothetical protein [Pedobacter panaciterrae]
MITPENNIPLDDSENSEAEDQQSQKDIHSNGLDDTFEEEKVEQPEIELFEQASKASEASYTLEPEKGIAPKKEGK